MAVAVTLAAAWGVLLLGRGPGRGKRAAGLGLPGSGLRGSGRPDAAGRPGTPVWAWPTAGGLVVAVSSVAVLRFGVGPVAVAAMVAVVGVVAAERAGARRARRRRATAELVEECVAVLAAELRAGRSAPDAWAGAADVAPRLLSPAARAAALGGDPTDAMRTAATTPGADTLRDVAAAWTVAQSTGAPMADLLGRAAARAQDDMVTLRGGRGAARSGTGHRPGSRRAAGSGSPARRRSGRRRRVAAAAHRLGADLPAGGGCPGGRRAVGARTGGAAGPASAVTWAVVLTLVAGVLLLGRAPVDVDRREPHARPAASAGPRLSRPTAWWASAGLLALMLLVWLPPGPWLLLAVAVVPSVGLVGPPVLVRIESWRGRGAAPGADVALAADLVAASLAAGVPLMGAVRATGEAVGGTVGADAAAGVAPPCGRGRPRVRGGGADQRCRARLGWVEPSCGPPSRACLRCTCSKQPPRQSVAGGAPTGCRGRGLPAVWPRCPSDSSSFQPSCSWPSSRSWSALWPPS